MALIGNDRSSAKYSLHKCRNKKHRLETAVDDLCHDIYRCEKQLNQAYRKHVRDNECAKKLMKDIGDFKLYPKGVRHGNFPLYTPEGERFPLERPAEGLTCKKYIKADTDRHIQYYALV